jgi:hypothetical protein
MRSSALSDALSINVVARYCFTGEVPRNVRSAERDSEAKGKMRAIAQRLVGNARIEPA